ncbi:o-succinylbenzoate synthase [Halobacillus andaensis]|uniref:o-succinylbenzoate synthase n=1 Tax=Halobacillus andaensis TaxID=1176239 RepID=UPI003D766255
MNINKITLNEVTIPLRNPFSTHLGELRERSVIIVAVEDKEGMTGYGEIPVFSTPFYTPETLGTAWHILKDIFLPSIQYASITHPSDLVEASSFIKGHQMAKSGIEGALWDLYARQHNRTLAAMIGGTRRIVKAGAVLSLSSNLVSEVAHLLDKGYERFKLKVEKGREEEIISSVREAYPDIPLMIDANGMYTFDDLDVLKRLDQYNLQMIEQPFRAGDYYMHQQLQQMVNTPLCLDESINSFQDVVQAVSMESCRVVNIKISRVGGLTEAVRIHDYCQAYNIPVWCGGMVETGVSKAHNLALASLSNFTIPGDLSHSTRYLEEDIIQPYVEVNDGQVEIPSDPGIGFSVDEERLARLSKRSWAHHI